MSDSRTANSLKNAGTALLFYFLNLLLGFFSRKAFFDYLGSEILGLNTTAGNILGLLNITELGIGNAVGYFLYKPLFNKDQKSICEIISLQGWMYRKVAYIILSLSAVSMLFFPWIFAKSPLPLFYAYTTFAAFLLGSMLSYFMNYKTILLSAAQKGYKLQFIYQTFVIVKTVSEILAITFSPQPYWAWLSIEVGMSILQTVALQTLIRKEYPWLRTDTSNGFRLLKKYSDIWVKTKQTFFHKIAYVAVTQSSPVIVYTFTSLTTVALYGNYILIVGKIGNLIRSVFDSTAASIGDLVASGDKKKIIEIFWELFDSRLMISTIGLTCLFFLTEPFIVLWLGRDYLLGKTFLVIYLLYNVVYMNRSTVDQYLNAYGLFKDIWAPVVEAVLHIGLGALGGYLWGISGIVFGIMCSQFVIISLWKPFFLFTEGFMLNPYKYYFLPIISRFSIASTVFLCVYFYFQVVGFGQIETVGAFVIECFHVGIISAIFSFAIFNMFSGGCRRFERRMFNLMKK